MSQKNVTDEGENKITFDRDTVEILDETIKKLTMLASIYFLLFLATICWKRLCDKHFWLAFENSQIVSVLK